MPDLNSPSYSTYAKQRLYRILEDLTKDKKSLNMSSMAQAVSDFHGTHFQRNNFYRLRDSKLQDQNIEIIVKWIEANYFPDIRDRLEPSAIFDEAGVADRDYYFHISEDNFLDDLDENLLNEYSGVYLCAPAWDKSSYLPLTFLRQWYDDHKAMTHIEKKGRSLDIKQYISERSLLILQRTPKYFFHAAEIPLSALFPEEFETGCIKMAYEGVAVMSSNSINVKLRECLSRVPKNHHILIRKKGAVHNNAQGVSLHVPPDAYDVRKEWAALSDNDLSHLKEEYSHSLQSDYYMGGPTQISVSPVPYLKNKVDMVFPRDHIFHRKPKDFLTNKEYHLIKPELENAEAIQNILDNPLIISELL